MSKVKIAFLAILFVLCSSRLALANEQQPSDQVKGCFAEGYNERVFLYPQAGQQGPIVVSEQSLQDKTNLLPSAAEWMSMYWREVGEKHLGQKYAAFAVNRNEQGNVCIIAVVDPELQVIDAPTISDEVVPPGPTSSIRNQKPQKRGPFNIISRVVLRYAPMALGFAGPVGVVSGLGLSVAAPKIDSKFSGSNGYASGPDAQQKLQKVSKSSKKQKYDHDENGSFATLFNRNQ